ncbi:MAG: hypothetical protein A2X46_09890 [Lentisphaerae bacterium GWF2_57_35]|nr:MAG: hypothetical protein A2X46_09890 [Lentisphaerae bacterium GWF2_57_35]
MPTAPDVKIDRADAQRTVVAVDLTGFWTQDRTMQGQTYTAVELDNWSSVQEVGKPSVPLYCVMLEIPADALPQVEVTACEETSAGQLLIPPVQPLLPDVSPEPPPPPFTMDAAVYAEDEFYPAGPVFSQSIVDLREKRLLVLQLVPVRWNPHSREALAAGHLEITVTMTPLPARLAQEDVTQAAGLLPDAASGDLRRYMILMDDQFEGNGLLTQFVDWKKRKGYKATVVKTSQINANGAPNNTQIINYMRGLAATNYPHYLLILGDHTETNGVAGKYFNSDTSDWYGYTDLDIACRTGADYIPDLYYGRLFATNSAQASNLLSKVLSMDRTPPSSAMFQKVCVAGQIQDSDDYNNVADRLFCETADLIASYFEQDAGGVDYTCTRAIVNPDGVTANAAWNGDSLLWNPSDQIGTRVFNHFIPNTAARGRISTNINEGVALLQHRDHGYVSGAGWADPSFYYSHVSALTNALNRPAVFSINCNSGMYNMYSSGNPSLSFVRQWLTHNNGGTYAFFGPVDTSYSWVNDWMTHGFYAAFLTNYISFQNNCTTPTWSKKLPSPNGLYGAAGKAWRLGEILNFGKMYMAEKYFSHETTFRLFHLFGDPEAELRLRTPRTLSVSHASSITPGISTTVAVTLAESGCDVCLYSPTAPIHLVQTNAGMVVRFIVTATTGSTMYVTATKQGCRPYEGTVLSFVGGSDRFWLRATAMTNSVMLRWPDPNDCAIASKVVHIRASTSAYPALLTDGAQVYQGENQSAEHTGLTPGQTYYYTIWVSHDGATFEAPP